MKRLLYGGSFDPVHAGHVTIAVAAGRLLAADRVSFVPAADPPHKPEGTRARAADRLEMCRLAAAEDPLLDVLDVEVRRGGVSWTIETVEELLAGSLRGDSVLLLVGQDALADLPKWRRVRELAALAPIAVAPRPGAPPPAWDALEAALGSATVDGIRSRWLATPEIDISSTVVRRRVAAGESIAGWVPPAVADYIAHRGLYRT